MSEADIADFWQAFDEALTALLAALARLPDDENDEQ